MIGLVLITMRWLLPYQSKGALLVQLAGLFEGYPPWQYMASLVPARGTADIDNTPTDVSPEQAALAAGPIIAAILSQLPVRQRCRLLSVNRAWRRAGDYPDVWAGLTLEQKRKSLISACIRGDLTLLRKRAKLFNFHAMDVRAQANLAFRETARNGHLTIAQWLSAHYDLTQIDIRAHYDSALYLACGNGHLEMAQWMVKHFNLTSANVQLGSLLIENMCKWPPSYCAMAGQRLQSECCQ